MLLLSEVTLKLKKAGSSGSEDYLFSTFANSAGFTLRNLDKTLNPSVSPFLPRLQTLSLSDCSLDIAEVAPNRTTQLTPSLRAANLSNNIC